MGEETVYPRDASWNATGKPSGKTLKLHFPMEGDPARSACGRVGLLNHDGSSDGCLAVDVPAHKRCRASGCRERWP